MGGRHVAGALTAALVLLSGCAGGGGIEEVRGGDGSGNAGNVVNLDETAEKEKPEPGKLVDVRPLSPDFIPAGSKGWEITYWSTGVHGDLVEVRGVVFAPDTEAPEGGFPVLSWGHGNGQMGIADGCAPTTRGAVNVPFAEDFIEQGYVIASTDYEGLGVEGLHPYLVAGSSGRSMLDVSRAAKHVPGANANDNVLFFGQSQGGQGALWAAKLAPEYAPDVKVRGVAAATPSIQMGLIVGAASVRPASFGFFALLVAAYDHAYDDLKASDILTEKGLESLDIVEEECSLDVLTSFADEDPASLVASPPQAHPAWEKRLTENELGESKIEAPLLIIHGMNDVVSHFAGSEIPARALCKGGTELDFRLQPGLDSETIVPKSKDLILKWLDARLEGAPIKSSCPELNKIT